LKTLDTPVDSGHFQIRIHFFNDTYEVPMPLEILNTLSEGGIYHARRSGLVV
jgi:hypothetical protein